MPEPAALREPDGPRFLQFENDVQANEAMLLATADAKCRGELIARHMSGSQPQATQADDPGRP